MQLNDIVSKIKEYMIFESEKPAIIDLILATALSLELDRPVWIMIVGRPASGKTELSKIIHKVKRVFPIHDLTDKALFSGHSSSGGGYMIRVIKKKGVLIFPDFTTVINNDSRMKKKIFNQLRTIYDGQSAKLTGMDTGQANIWKGKVAIISLVTESIDEEIELSSDLGERFIYFRYNPKEISPIELSKFVRNIDAKIEVQEMVVEFIESKKNEINDVKLSEDEFVFISKLAKILSIGRAKVKRNSKRGVERIHSPEDTHRLVIALSSLYKSLICINADRGCSLNIVKKIILDSIPELRVKILNAIISSESKTAKYERIRNRIYGISDAKVRRTIDDMCLQKMIYEKDTGLKNSKFYSFAEDFGKLMEIFL